MSLNNAKKYLSEEILKGKKPMFDIAAQVHRVVTPVLSGHERRVTIHVYLLMGLFQLLMEQGQLV